MLDDPLLAAELAVSQAKVEEALAATGSSSSRTP